MGFGFPAIFFLSFATSKVAPKPSLFTLKTGQHTPEWQSSPLVNMPGITGQYPPEWVVSMLRNTH
jgi:hypothetical protein